MILGGLAKNAQSPDGAAALSGALAKHSPDILSNIAGAVGSAGHEQTGMKILGHALGGHTETAGQGIGQATGLDSAQVMKLMATLAPLVMGALAKHNQPAAAAGPSAGGGLGSLLQAGLSMATQQAPSNTQGALGGLLGGLLGGGGGGAGALLGSLLGGGQQQQQGQQPQGGGDMLGSLIGGLLK